MPDGHDGLTSLGPTQASGGEHGRLATATPKSFVDAAFAREELTALRRIAGGASGSRCAGKDADACAVALSLGGLAAGEWGRKYPATP